MASVESLMLIAVGTLILMGLYQYWQTQLAPRTNNLIAQVLGQEVEQDGARVSDFATSLPKPTELPKPPRPEQAKTNEEQTTKKPSGSIAVGANSDDGFYLEGKASKEIHSRETEGGKSSASISSQGKITGQSVEIAGGVKGQSEKSLGGGFKGVSEGQLTVGLSTDEGISVKISGKSGLESAKKGDAIFITSEVGSTGAKIGLRFQGGTESSFDGVPNDGDNIFGEGGRTTKKLPYFDIKSGREVQLEDGTTKREYTIEIGGGTFYLSIGFDDIESS